ncbi:MAG TPA: T9SS type A sorting domain-containing protein, partial [Candidatus Kapabacteria bacterium]|nr:T9SS type A sorting domain-containing protein [Candidatus Kapabacteria bacterium]
GIHFTGDTIFKLNFYVNQILENNSTPIIAMFTPDSTYPYLHFYSSPGTFAELPCASPASVYPATAAHLMSTYPNPFNPQAIVRFSADQTGYVSINLYNSFGVLVRTLVNGIVTAGVHSVVFDGSDLPSGKYICRLYTPVSSEIILSTLSK